ncbi:Ubiquinol-cytochrome-c reductase complex assembly factor 1 [Desmophyllum pertusum]|uniref:Ubiquinol-cytochrome-c reductase complex assembly factor 1 n=1 Tax=Desmophyllum pertusum TaxID=174260 RepID=A0A9W9YI81_9CNID|nr:Ubiquinol-cytochrome-c reductase complex assembly factor 1 [Desmophyllum pertusum]
MFSIASKLIYRSSGSLRGFLLLSTASNFRAIQAPLSCSACRHVRLFANERDFQDKMTRRYALNNPAAHYARFQSTAQGSGSGLDAVENKLENRGTLMDRIVNIVRVVAAPVVKRTVLVGSARTMYECGVEGMNFEEFFEACELPDTLQSWFTVLHLHIWMCLVRLKAEGKDGKFMYRKLIQIMWLDVEERIKNLGTIDTIVIRDTLQALLKQFHALIIAYDEGLLSDDTVLATTIWRNLFSNKKHTDAEQLGRLVEYVRKNVQYLESIPGEHLLHDGSFKWLPLKEQEMEEAEETQKEL